MVNDYENEIKFWFVNGFDFIQIWYANGAIALDKVIIDSKKIIEKYLSK